MGLSSQEGVNISIRVDPNRGRISDTCLAPKMAFLGTRIPTDFNARLLFRAVVEIMCIRDFSSWLV